MVQPGDPFRVSARLQNPGPAETVDVYLGTILPDGASAVMVTSLDPVTTTVARLDGGPAGSRRWRWGSRWRPGSTSP